MGNFTASGRRSSILALLTWGGLWSGTQLPTQSASSFNPYYQHIATVPGSIIDVTSEAILYMTPDQSLVRFDRASETSTTIRTNFVGWSVLTAAGAMMHIYSTGIPKPVPVLDFNRGEEIYLGDRGMSSLGDGRRVTEGRYGIIHTLTGSFLRDFVAKTNYAFSQVPLTADVSENGRFAFASFASLYWYDGEGLKELESGTQSSIPHVQTDGTNVLWASGASQSESIYLWNGERKITLATNVTIQWDYTGLQTAMNAGWTAFPRRGPDGQREIWRRSPAGVISQATFSPTNAHIKAMRSDGALLVTFEHTNAPPLVYLPVNGAPKDLGTDFNGIYFASGDGFFVYPSLSGTLYYLRVDEEPFGLASPQFDSATGIFSFSLATTGPGTFLLEHSSNLVNWMPMATNTFNAPQSRRFDLTAPPGFLRLRRQ